MPDLELEFFVEDQETIATSVDGDLDLEFELSGTSMVESLPDEVELGEVTLPEGMSLDGMVLNAGNAPALMVLGTSDPVPPGTPAGTVILRQ